MPRTPDRPRTTINSLPVEIFIAIIKLTVLYPELLDQDWAVATYYPSLYDIALVCKSWRDLSFSCPEL